MGDKHLDTISETESDEFIKSSVEDLVLILSEFEGIPDKMCDVPFHDNSLPLDISKDQFEDFSESNDDSTSIDDDYFSIDDIEYVEASPSDSKLVSKEVVESVILEVGGIDTDILSSTTIHSDYSLPDYESFYDDHIEEKSSGSTATYSDLSLSRYDSFIFDLSINPFPSADRSDFYYEEFAGELAHIISLSEYDCFFKNEPELGDFTMDVVGDIFSTREPRVYVPNVLPTHPTHHLDLDFILSSETLFAYVVCPDVESSRAHCFVPRASHPQLHFGNLISISYRLTFILKSMSPDTSLVGCQKPGHLAARLGCANTKVATWDDLAFNSLFSDGT
uniref:Reverse transcriptase domain-containing protein n=1 Tax=Tanacetum cinerariifolium TaxID=118510 RepID=A0A6L2N1F3_TANCI|nr:hypothetical protein [Tanacetum cinerariifolium]